MNSNSLSHVLSQANLISTEQLEQLKCYMHQEKMSAIESIFKLKLLSADTLQTHLSQIFNIKKIDINQSAHLTHYRGRDLTTLIFKHRALPIRASNQQLTLAISDPTNIHAENDFSFSTGLNIECLLANHQQLMTTIDGISPHKSPSGTHTISTEEIPSELMNSKQDSVKQFVQQVIIDAVQKGASDIHFEPYQGIYRIRIRCDGILLITECPSVHLAPQIASIIKILAKLDITERRFPQDGHILMELDNQQTIDIRVSTLPCSWGEKLVLRIVDNQKKSLDINMLGFNDQQKKRFLNALKKPQGMILITGPTGSGKTASLYAALNILNTSQCNISTAEDPIEVNVFGINQVQVNDTIGLTFNQALRTFLRQDPDIIMLGEIRDNETASIATKAAQTGHLVLSTLHTNSAIDTIIRLTSMGIHGYNLTASLSLIIAQRLIRKLCPSCKTLVRITEFESNKTGLNLNTYLYKANNEGCSKCHYGYKGRTGIFEVLPITEQIKTAIEQQVRRSELLSVSENNNMTTLKQSAIAKLEQGITSFSELQRALDI